jgi:hypothetical protein
MFHNLTTSSTLPPLTTFFPSGDNAIVCTSPFLSHQSSHICFPLLKLHTRSERSLEQVIVRYPPGRYIKALTQLVCPSNFWLGVISDASCIPTMGEDMILNFDYLVHCHLSFHPTKFKPSLTMMFLRSFRRLDTMGVQVKSALQVRAGTFSMHYPRVYSPWCRYIVSVALANISPLTRPESEVLCDLCRRTIKSELRGQRKYLTGFESHDV